MKIRILSFIMLGLLLSTGLRAQMSSEERSSARNIWLKGFEFYEQGENALKQNDPDRAMRSFRDAEEHFERVKQRYPRWNSALIEYRLKLCAKRISDIEKAGLLKQKPADARDRDTLVKNRLSQVEAELSRTRRELETTQISLEEARREAARGTSAMNQMKQLIAAKSDLERRCAALQGENRRLQQKNSSESNAELRRQLNEHIGEIASMKASMDQLETEKKQIHELYQNTAAQKTQIEFELAEAKKKAEKTDNSLREAAVALAENRREIEQNSREQKTLQQEIENQKSLLLAEKEQNERLRKTVKQLHDNADISAIAKQLETDNELLLRDIETANLKLAKALKEKAEAETAAQQSSDRIKELETILVNVEKNRKSLNQDLITAEKKLMMADAVREKQDLIIAEVQEQNSTLKKELEQLGNKLAEYQKKESGFSEIARQSLAVEEKNRQMSAKLEKLSKEIEENKSLEGVGEKLKSANDELETVKAIVSRKDKELASTKEQVEQMQMKLKQEQHKQTQMGKDHKQEIEKLQSSISRLEKQVAAAEEKVNIPKVTANTEELERLRKESGQLKIAIRTSEQEISELKEKLTETTAPPPEPTVSTPVMKHDDEALKILIEAGLAAEKNGNREAAIWHYQKILETNPEHTDALTRLGIMAAEKGNDDSARKYLETALQKDPEDLEKLLALSFTYLRQGENLLAIGAVSRAAAHDPENPEMQRYLGVACANLGWNQAAEQQFKNAFKSNPESSETAFNLAVLIASSEPDRMAEARSWYRKAIELGAESDPGMEEMFSE